MTFSSSVDKLDTDLRQSKVDTQEAFEVFRSIESFSSACGVLNDGLDFLGIGVRGWLEGWKVGEKFDRISALTEPNGIQKKINSGGKFGF
jgi:hypothetical protein